LELNNFHEIFSGFELLRLCYIDKSDILKMYQKVDQSKICFNKSSSLNQIEFNYVYGFLGLQATEENFLNNKEIFTAFIRARVELINRVRPDLKSVFREGFSLSI
jgi:hypothetical protein